MSVFRNRTRTAPKAFSLVELVVSMTIMAILGAIGFLSYSASLLGARDTSRVADIDQLKMSLKSEKQKTGAYPLPGNAFIIINSWATNIAAYQGFLNSSVAVNGLTKYPLDPLTGGSYLYSTAKNRQFFQLATVAEAAVPWTAYVDGDYKSVAINLLPSILLAMTGSTGSGIEIATGITSSGSVGSVNRLKFILNGGSANLPYDASGKPVGNTWLTFSGVLSQSGVVTTGNGRFRSCTDINEWGAYVGPGEYQVLANDGTIQNVICP